MSYFKHGDRVVYLGTKTFTDDQGKPISLNDKVGEVCSGVQNEPTGVVVDFGNHSFIMSEKVLKMYVPSKDKDQTKAKDVKEPEVLQRRKRAVDEDEA